MTYEVVPYIFFGLGFIAGLSATMLVVSLRKALCKHDANRYDTEYRRWICLDCGLRQERYQ